MGLTADQYWRAVESRVTLSIRDCPSAQSNDMKTLSEAGWDGAYVVPNQLSSRSLDGPLILLNNWFGWRDLEKLDPSIKQSLQRLGYIQGIPTNRWLDRALEIVGLRRSEIYVTQACVFLPRDAMGSVVPREAYELSVERVLKLELGGRTAVALGGPAQHVCERFGIPFVSAKHPSYQGGERRSQEIAAAILKVL